MGLLGVCWVCVLLLACSTFPASDSILGGWRLVEPKLPAGTEITLVLLSDNRYVEHTQFPDGNSVKRANYFSFNVGKKIIQFGDKIYRYKFSADNKMLFLDSAGAEQIVLQRVRLELSPKNQSAAAP